jgi:hypothetical protein
VFTFDHAPEACHICIHLSTRMSSDVLE